MPANKKTSRKSPDKNYRGNEKNPTGKARANDENLHRPYQGYDENKTTNNPAYQSNYDVDENDSNQRLGEYSDWAKTVNQDRK